MKIANNHRHLHISKIKLTGWILFSILASGFLVHICHRALQREIGAELESCLSAGDGLGLEESIYQQADPLMKEVNSLFRDLKTAGKAYRNTSIDENTEVAQTALQQIENTENRINEQLKEIASTTRNSTFKGLYENMIAGYNMAMDSEMILRRQSAYTPPAPEHTGSTVYEQEIERLKNVIQNNRAAISELNQKNHEHQARIGELRKEKQQLTHELKTVKAQTIAATPVNVLTPKGNPPEAEKPEAAKALKNWWRGKQQTSHRNKTLPLAEVKFVYEGFKNNKEVLLELDRLINNL